MTVKHSLLLSAALTVAGLALAEACQSSGGGTSCFAPEHGPPSVSCADYTVGLSCPVDEQPWFTCTCTQRGSAQSWLCMPAGGTGGSFTGAGGGGQGGFGTGGAPPHVDAGPDGAGGAGGTGAASGDGGEDGPG